MSKHKSLITDNCPLARYIHRLGAVGSLVTLNVEHAARYVGITRHSVHSEVRDLRLIGMIQAEPSNVGEYTIRILR